MSKSCQKVFALDVALAAAWVVSDLGYGNDPGFTGDSTSATWDVGSVATAIPASVFPFDPPPWHDAYTHYLGACMATITFGPYADDKTFTVDVSGTLTSVGAKPLWLPPDFGAAPIEVTMSNLILYSGDYSNSTGGNSTLPYSETMTGILVAGLQCGIMVRVLYVDGIDGASTSTGSLTIAIA